MSGTVCEIIIRGNKLQANAIIISAIQPAYLVPADYAVANARSICQLGTLTYDSVEVMNDAQKMRAATMMGEFNSTVDSYVADPKRPDDQPLLDALNQFNQLADALLSEVAGGQP